MQWFGSSRRNWRFAAGWALAGLLAAAAASSQQNPQQPPRPGGPTIRATTRLVQVSVIVQDSSGAPLPNLKREDFTLLDEGQSQEISVFSVESAEKITDAPALPSDTFSNLIEQRRGTPRSVTVILLDALNTQIEDQAYARQQVIKFLQQLQPGDRVALFTLGSRLRMLHDFTQDAASLLRSLDRYRGRTATGASTPDIPAPEETGEADLDEWLRDATRRELNVYAIDRARRTLRAIEAIARYLARLPGRKNLVWVSAGFPIAIGFEDPRSRNYMASELQGFGPDLDRLARVLSHADLAIYPVDARGLVGDLSLNIAAPDLDRTAAIRGQPRANPQYSRAEMMWSTQETMRFLADRTGGRAAYNTNDIRGAIRRALEESRVTYVLGYYPAHDRWDGRFRRIRVQVRGEESRVRHREGYFAVPDEPPDNRRRQESLLAAAETPLDASELGLTVFLDRAGDALKLEQHVEPVGISLARQQDLWVGQLDFFFYATDAEGKKVSSQQQTLNLRISPSDYATFNADGLSVAKTLPLPKGALRLRIVVRDTASGRLGSVTIPFAEPARQRTSN